MEATKTRMIFKNSLDRFSQMINAEADHQPCTRGEVQGQKTQIPVGPGRWHKLTGPAE